METRKGDKGMDRARRFHLLLLGMGFLLIGVWADVTSSQSVDVGTGRRLFRSHDWTATGLTCLHCHADFNEKKEPDDYVRSGYSISNAGLRTEWQIWDG